VLPLRPLQPLQPDEVLELGVADTLITRLGTLSGILVRPVSAVRAHRGAGQDALAIGRELGADVVLEGTLQRDGEAVRVNVRLLTIGDGTLIWGQSFDVPFTGIFAVEDTIAGHVASALSSSLSAQERARYARRHIPPVEAYRLYLEGRNHWHAWPSPGYEQSRACFEQAIALDPAYSQAYVGLAHYFGLGAAMGLLRPADAWPPVETATATALHLDPHLGEAYNAVAAYEVYVRHDWTAAEHAFKHALEINPNDAETRNHYGLSLGLFGRPDEALAQIDYALQIDPLASRFRRNKALVLYQVGRYEAAIEECERVAESDSAYAYVFELLGDVYEQTGRLGDALEQWTRPNKSPRRRRPGKPDRASFRAALQRLWQPRLAAMMRRRDAGDFVPAMHVARAHARMGCLDDALIWIEKASYERNRLILELPQDPHFDSLRSHPRFQQVVARLPNRDFARAPQALGLV
jgi:tetratricopeptide (TPR) repeat protein